MDFVNSVFSQITTTFTLPVLKSILHEDSSSKVENIVRLILFLIFTPLAILAQLAVMAVVKLLMMTLELWAFLKENTMADNLTMMMAFLINTILSVPGKMLFNEENNKDSGKAIYEDIYKEIYEVCHDSGIDSSEFSDSQSETFDGGRERQLTKHSVEKGKVIKCQQKEDDEEREEFGEPHDAWVLETGKGAFRPDFKEEVETFYLVFWYWICNNMLS